MKLRDLLRYMEKLQKKASISQAFICGGVPRDRYLNRLDNIDDIDLTTGDQYSLILSNMLYERLSTKFKIFHKIYNDGHSSINIGKLKLDFSSNYNIPEIDTELFKLGIKNITPLKKETYSRDFTCNTLLLPFSLKDPIDLTNMAFNDLNHKLIRTCLPPEITLINSKNRVIRSIYLASKLGFNIDKSIISFVKANPKVVNISSKNSIIKKLNKAFTIDPDRASFYLDKMNLWDEIPITEIVRPYYDRYIRRSIVYAK